MSRRRTRSAELALVKSYNRWLASLNKHAPTRLRWVAMPPLLSPDKLNGVIKLSFSPARFLDPATANPVLVQVLNRFDLFTIWVTVLLAIGVYVTGRVSKSQATIAGVLFWIVGAIPALLGALRQAAAA